jgi:hypothetical protein
MSLEYRVRDFGREKSQAEQAGDIAPVESLGACYFANSASFATKKPTEPLMRACERLDEIDVGFGSVLSSI